MKKIREENPDLAILDVIMTTHYEGFELAKEITDDPELRNMPILMQTSIDVLTTTKPDVQAMAREFRKNPGFKDLHVLLVKDINTGKAGVDYLSEDGKNIWFPVDGFIRKPVDSKKNCFRSKKNFRNVIKKCSNTCVMKTNIDIILEKYENISRDSLIPLLQEIQEKEGYISEEAIVKIGKKLNLSTSKIYGVATFYNQFRFEPIGKYHIQVCRGTACHVLGSATVLQELESMLKIKAGQTTRDGLFSIEVVACIGACGLAPVISVNGEFYANVTSEKINEIIEYYRSKVMNHE